MNTLPETIQQALTNVLEYVRADEFKDYVDTPPSDRSGHIFESVLKLRRWLNNPSGEPNYFGACPLCGDGQNDGFLNLGRSHWFVCHIHRKRWCAGENLFSCWRDETKEDWVHNWGIIEEYDELPVPPTP